MTEENNKIEPELSISMIKTILNLDELALWWISVLIVVLALLFYYFIKISPIRELIVLASIVFFIFQTSRSFWK